MKVPSSYTGVLLIDESNPPVTVRLSSDRKGLLKQVLNLVQTNLGKTVSKEAETTRIISVLIVLLNCEQNISDHVQMVYKYYRLYKSSVCGKLIQPVGLNKINHTEIPLIGMDNYLNTTCYLDSILVALFYSNTSFDYLLDKSADPNLSEHFQNQIENLKIILRFIVNLLRAGEQIVVNIMYQLLLVLNSLGCTMVLSGKQQDSLQMFDFLAESLSLPLLTLKLDIIHTGKLNVNDDLRLIGERSLLISIPTSHTGTEKEVTLEECLNSYFNNSITVRRHLDQKKYFSQIEQTVSKPAASSPPSRATSPDSVAVQSISEACCESPQETTSEINEYEKLGILKSSLTSIPLYNVSDTVTPQPSSFIDIPSRECTPISITESFATPVDQQTQQLTSPSVVTFSPTKKNDGEISENEDSHVGSYQNMSQKLERQRTRSSTLTSVLNNVQSINPNKLTRRSSSISNTEVALPAWMYLQLLPYYTNPDVKLQVENHEEYYRRRQSRSKTIETITNVSMGVSASIEAANPFAFDEKEEYFNRKFANKRPIVPICLKRYTWNDRGKPVKIKRKVSIPEIMNYPYFIAEDKKKPGYVDFKRSFDHKAPRGSFMLVLQSLVCHRGNTISSGHYICVTRKRSFDVARISTTANTSTDDEWILFNDMLKGREKSKVVKLQDVIDSEDPYILFYEVVEIKSDYLSSQLPAGFKDTYWNRKQSVISSISGLSEQVTLQEDNSDTNLSKGSRGLSLGNLSLTKSRRHHDDILDEYYWYGDDLRKVQSIAQSEKSMRTTNSSTSAFKQHNNEHGGTVNCAGNHANHVCSSDDVAPEVHVMEVSDSVSTHNEEVNGNDEVKDDDDRGVVESDIDFCDEKNELHLIRSRLSSMSPPRKSDSSIPSIDFVKSSVTKTASVVKSSTKESTSHLKSNKNILSLPNRKVKKLFKKVFS